MIPTEEQVMIRDMARAFAAEKLAPNAADWDRDSTFPAEAIREMGTLGSGNHYLEVQAVTELFDQEAADAYNLEPDDVVVTIHCGSRGLGHQIGTEIGRAHV